MGSRLISGTGSVAGRRIFSFNIFGRAFYSCEPGKFSNGGLGGYLPGNVGLGAGIRSIIFATRRHARVVRQ